MADPWSQHFIRAATKHLRHMVGMPLRVLEIGVHEAGSAEWLLDRVLTHDDSMYFGIDPYFGKQGTLTTARRRLSRFGSKVELIVGKSMEVLPEFPVDVFDVIHIDGDHKPEAALADGFLSWPLLKPGGLMAWDDLHHKSRPVVKPAFDVFRRLHAVEVLEDARQGWLRKLPPSSAD